MFQSDALDLQLFEDLKRPGPHFKPETDCHCLGVDAAAQVQLLPQGRGSLLCAVHSRHLGERTVCIK